VVRTRVVAVRVLTYAVTSRNSGDQMFSVMCGPCSFYIREPNSEAGSCRSTEEYKMFNRVQELVKLS
jgi:hypothetical protein